MFKFLLNDSFNKESRVVRRGSTVGPAQNSALRVLLSTLTCHHNARTVVFPASACKARFFNYLLKDSFSKLPRMAWPSGSLTCHHNARIPLVNYFSSCHHNARIELRAFFTLSLHVSSQRQKKNLRIFSPSTCQHNARRGKHLQNLPISYLGTTAQRAEARVCAPLASHARGPGPGISLVSCEQMPPESLNTHDMPACPSPRREHAQPEIRPSLAGKSLGSVRFSFSRSQRRDCSTGHDTSIHTQVVYK